MIALWTLTTAVAQNKSLDFDVFYISLLHRKDRQVEIEKALNMAGIKFEMIKAIKGRDSMMIKNTSGVADLKKQIGSIGCGLSHIKALEHSTKNVLILEDDVYFNKWPNFKGLLKQDWWDVIQFSYKGWFLKKQCHTFEKIKYCKTNGAVKTSAYFVRNEYRRLLIDVFSESVNRLKQNENPDFAAIDQVWKKLAKPNRWFVPTPGIAFQRASFSDIEQTYIDYFKNDPKKK